MGYFGDILCVATRNLLLKRLVFRGFREGEGFGEILCVATGNLLLKRLATRFRGFLGSGWGIFGFFRGNRALGRVFCGNMMSSHTQSTA